MTSPAPDAKSTLIYGAGGHGQVVAEALLAAGQRVLGFFDDGVTGTVLGLPVFGPYSAQLHPEALLILAVGSPQLRARLAAQVSHAWGRAVHPSATLSPTAQVGVGAMVLPSAVVHTHARIGAHAIVNSAAVVEHHCTIGAFVHVSPGAVLCGGAQVGEGTLIGPGVVVEKQVRIGSYCTVAAGAVVVRDVPDGTTVMGVPARVV